MHITSSTSLASSLLLLTTVLSSTLVSALPQRPGPIHPPNCPYFSQLAGEGRVFLRLFYQPAIGSQPGGYRDFTQPFFWDNFTITDLTPNYPAPEKGKKLPPPGTWAKSRIEFADKLQQYIPKVYAVLGNVALDGNLPSFGQLDDNNCLTYIWESHYTATLLKKYNGKPAGTNVSWVQKHSFTTRHPLPNEDDGTGYIIQNATVKNDFSSFFT